jgi:hypothetical protein
VLAGLNETATDENFSADRLGVLLRQNASLKLVLPRQNEKSNTCFASAKRGNQILVLPRQNEEIKYFFRFATHLSQGMSQCH